MPDKIPLAPLSSLERKSLETWICLIATCRRLAGDLRAAGSNPANHAAWEAGWKLDVLLAEDVIAKAENHLAGDSK